MLLYARRNKLAWIQPTSSYTDLHLIVYLGHNVCPEQIYPLPTSNTIYSHHDTNQSRHPYEQIFVRSLELKMSTPFRQQYSTSSHDYSRDAIYTTMNARCFSSHSHTRRHYTSSSPLSDFITPTPRSGYFQLSLVSYLVSIHCSPSLCICLSSYISMQAPRKS